MNDLPKIEVIPFPESQFYREEFEKKQIVLHHTASGRGASGDYKHWLTNEERVATCQIINQDGTSAQLFNSKYWGHHIGCGHPNNRKLNQQSIAIEIDSWGGLTFDEKDRVFKSYTGTIVPKENVHEYEKSFRGFRFYEKYTPEQIESTRKFILFWSKTYGIPLAYNEDMWDVSNKALEGTPGVWAHVSFRKDKADVHPQPELIEMLKKII
jgi:N-acetyl-anhydromuramyl-L-alanine amidase AmpD